MNDLVGAEGSCDDLVAGVAELLSVVPGVLPQDGEGLVHIDVGGVAEDPFGLIEDHAAVQGMLQLGVDGVPVAGDSLLDDSDAGHVREGLRRLDVNGLELAGLVTEQAQRAEDGVP